MTDRSDKFTWPDDAGGLEASQCIRCKHKYADGRMGCAAFPEDIPLDILLNNYDHRKPHVGDNGIRFEPLGEGEEAPETEAPETI